MDIKACRNCGKIFQARGSYICTDCVHKMDKQFIDVRNYMYENPRATIEEICEENNVTADMVMSWLREGRLIVAQGSEPLLKCDGCGKPLSMGRLCPACAGTFSNRIGEASKDMERAIQQQREAAERRGYHIDNR